MQKCLLTILRQICSNFWPRKDFHRPPPHSNPVRSQAPQPPTTNNLLRTPMCAKLLIHISGFSLFLLPRMEQERAIQVSAFSRFLTEKAELGRPSSVRAFRQLEKERRPDVGDRAQRKNKIGESANRWFYCFEPVLWFRIYYYADSGSQKC